jgi:predicted PurR-regulated permease PerM
MFTIIIVVIVVVFVVIVVIIISAMSHILSSINGNILLQVKVSEVLRKERRMLYKTTPSSHHNSSFTARKLVFNPLTPESKSSAQRCLTKFFTGVFLVEPCISLIYA